MKSGANDLAIMVGGRRPHVLATKFFQLPNICVIPTVMELSEILWRTKALRPSISTNSSSTSSFMCLCENLLGVSLTLSSFFNYW